MWLSLWQECCVVVCCAQIWDMIHRNSSIKTTVKVIIGCSFYWLCIQTLNISACADSSKCNNYEWFKSCWTSICLFFFFALFCSAVKCRHSSECWLHLQLSTSTRKPGMHIHTVAQVIHTNVHTHTYSRNSILANKSTHSIIFWVSVEILISIWLEGNGGHCYWFTK